MGRIQIRELGRTHIAERRAWWSCPRRIREVLRRSGGGRGASARCLNDVLAVGLARHRAWRTTAVGDQKLQTSRAATWKVHGAGGHGGRGRR